MRARRKETKNFAQLPGGLASRRREEALRALGRRSDPPEDDGTLRSRRRTRGRANGRRTTHPLEAFVDQCAAAAGVAGAGVAGAGVAGAGVAGAGVAGAVEPLESEGLAEGNFCIKSLTELASTFD